MLPPNAADYEKIKSMFAAALDLAQEQRADFLSRTGAEQYLIDEVESLLTAQAEAGEFLNKVSAATIRDSIKRGDQHIGETVEKYRLEREIGRGGMGIVYLATREDFQQQVALKLIKRGMDSEAILERFRREREILAALNHPFIARLLDGGTTNDDTPFFVMEYVEGVPIDEFCRNANLAEKEKLMLFRKVCEALIFAHQKLIVHRDLKPSNILVTADGTPKLLDFGIAKLLDSTAAETQTHQRVLTPAYASPEQIRGDSVDTTSDIYSLGLILSEMLGTNGKQFKVQGSSFRVQNQSDGQISKRDVQKASSIQNPKSKIQNLNADLQNILEMALREERARRYGSVEKFSEDVRRYLAGLPVAARKDTFSYRAGKFLKRNRLAATVSVLFAVTMVIGIAATLWQAREAQNEREIAERRFENLRKMSDSFTQEIHGAIQNLPGSLPARRILMRRAVEQLDALAAESSDNPALQDELAQAYFDSARLPDMLLAEKDLTLRKGLGIYQNLAVAAPTDTRYREQTALGDLALGDITKVRGSLAGALELDQAGISLLEQINEKEPADENHLANLAGAYQETSVIYILKGDAENAGQLNRKESAVIDAIKKINPAAASLKEAEDILQIRIAVVQTMAQDYKAAINTLQSLLTEYETTRIKTPNDTSVVYFLFVINRRLAETLEKNGDLKTASEHFQTALIIIENSAAQSPKDFGYQRNSAATHVLYGKLLIRRKRMAEAEEQFNRAINLSEQILETDTNYAESKIDLARANGNLGITLLMQGNRKEGLNHLIKAVNIFRDDQVFDEDNAELINDYNEFRRQLD